MKISTRIVKVTTSKGKIMYRPEIQRFFFWRVFKETRFGTGYIPWPYEAIVEFETEEKALEYIENHMSKKAKSSKSKKGSNVVSTQHHIL
jgi:hypothetical protein